MTTKSPDPVDLPTASSKRQEQVPSTLPLLPVRDIVVFPYMVLPLFVGRKGSIEAVDDALASDRMLMMTAQRDAELEEPGPEDLYTIGTVGMIVRMLKLPDGRVKILIQGLTKARLKKFIQREPYFRVEIDVLKEEGEAAVPVEVEALMRNAKEQLDRVITLGKSIPQDVLIVAESIDEPGQLADLVASNLGLKVEDGQLVLEIEDSVERLRRVAELLNRELELITIQQKIQAEAKEEMTKTQREYFLREQQKAIQKELGETDERSEEMAEYRKKIEAAGMTEEVAEEAEKQLKRLERMHPDAAEASIVRTYLDWMVELPWGHSTEDVLDIQGASKILDEDHYNLDKVKERILEYLGVRKLKEQTKGPILCFVGPPGVGKTSLGKSIARALGRKFVRISLGGIRDEAEIRGHRRTYVGALPGRIIQGMRQAGSNNPVFMMDEIDKVGADFRGDPTAALLEVLDPEQNTAFSDHYLGVPFDLSNVMFITTANLMDPILPALKDRMEVITIPGYTENEKYHIVRKFLMPKQLEEHGLTDKRLVFSRDALYRVITHYTREAGVRNIEREVAKVCRKVARRVAEGEDKLFRISVANLQTYLGVPKFLPDTEIEAAQVGVANGLAWTQTGGEILKIEATTMKGKGKGGELTLTGHLGDVMKESAKAALSYLRARAERFNIDETFFSEHDIHVHVPAGATPKDGPSAGIAMAVALASALTDIPARNDVAMTGEITLRGRVLPIGGIKEKTLAAQRAGINHIILPQRNKKDLEDIPPPIRRKMHFIFCETMDEVLDQALTKPMGLGEREAKSPTAARKRRPPEPPAVAESPAHGGA
ncbi:MAG: endopeptidase La [bacterium]|nr:endopeptidase La [bacterium]